MSHSMFPSFAQATVLLVFAGSAAALEQGITTQVFENPIEKVVTMLQSMRQNVRSEGEADKNHYDKLSCDQLSGGMDLEQNILAAQDKVSKLSVEIEAAEETLKEVEDDVRQHQADRDDIKAAMEKATALREKEAATFVAEKTDADAAKLAIAKAIIYIEKGPGRGLQGSFAQTSAAEVLRGFVMDEIDRYSDLETLLEFLSMDQVSVDGPKGGEVIRALKQMGGIIAETLSNAIAAEEASIQMYDEYMASKRMEVQAMTNSINLKTEQMGNLRINTVQMIEDITNAKATLTTDEERLAALQKNCATKTAEWEQRSKMRSEELAALADAIDILHAGDALDLFKKTLGDASASLMHRPTGFVALQTRVLHEVRNAWRVADVQHRPALDFLVLALSKKRSSSQAAYDKVIGMCDAIVGELSKEQKEEANRKKYCETQLYTNHDRQRAKTRALRDEGSKITQATDMITMLSEEIESMEVGLVELDTYIEEATEQRQEENKNFKTVVAAEAQAQELLSLARNRLSNFYHPSSGSGAVLLGIRPHQEANEAEPYDSPYPKKFEESSSAISMLDIFIHTLDKDITEATRQESDSQADYETLIKDSASKRNEDSQVIGQKVEAKADTEKALSDHKERKQGAAGNLLSTLEYVQKLHIDCDRLLEFFDARQTARMGEIDALVQAKSELHSAY